jgi:hypothetical protein
MNPQDMAVFLFRLLKSYQTIAAGNLNLRQYQRSYALS